MKNIINLSIRVLLLFIIMNSGYRTMNQADYTAIKHVMQILFSPVQTFMS